MSAERDREEPAKDGEEPAKDLGDVTEKKDEADAKGVAARDVQPSAPRAAARAPARDVDLLERLSEQAWVLIALLVPASIVVGFIQGPGAAILVLIAAALISVIALFWSSIRTLLGETPLTGADAFAIAAPRAEEEQKQAVLRALKDLEFERSVGKISDEDYAALVTKYRAEAKRLLRVLDDEARPRRERVEHLVHRRLVEAGLAAPEPSAETSRSPAPAPEEKKKKKKRKADATSADAAAAVPDTDPGADRRVEIEPDGEAAGSASGSSSPREAKKVADKGKAPIDITWKSPLPTKTKESPAYVPPTKKCSECGTKNDPDANFCKKCGSKAFESVTGGNMTTSAGDAESAEPAATKETAGGDAAAEETDR